MRTTTTLLFAAWVCATAIAQPDLTYYDTLAHYTLINDTTDRLGMEPPVLIGAGAQFQGDSGVYASGVYELSGMPDPSLVTTENITGLYDTAFAVSVAFMIEEYPAFIEPVLMLGRSWRYLGVYVDTDGTVAHKINNAAPVRAPDIKVDTNQWYRATIIYTAADSTAQYWLDDVLFGRRNDPLIRQSGDGKVMNQDFGTGTAFKGFWRNLVVMSSTEALTNLEFAHNSSLLKIYPNPTNEYINIPDPENFSRWAIYQLSGKMIGSGVVDGSRIDVRSLPVGTYLLQVKGPSGSQSVAKLVKSGN